MDTHQPRGRAGHAAGGPGVRRRGRGGSAGHRWRRAAPAAVAGLGAAAFGALDDLAGDSGSKGLRGHLSALASGRVTTGAVKVLGLGPHRRGRGGPVRPAAARPAPGARHRGRGRCGRRGGQPGQPARPAPRARAQGHGARCRPAAADRLTPAAPAPRRWRSVPRSARSRATSPAPPCSVTPAPTAPAPWSVWRCSSAPGCAAGSPRSPCSPHSPSSPRRSASPRSSRRRPGLRELDALGRRPAR